MPHQWLDWADEYLSSHDPVAILFRNPLITRDHSLFHHYSWHPSSAEHDEWLETWRG